jgi:hypothetical protein
MKKIILAISIVAVVVAGICLLPMRPAKAIPVNGNLSAQDITDIKRFLKRDLRRKILPDFSWRSFKGLPAAARNYFKYEILEIDASTDPNETVLFVKLTFHRSASKPEFSYYQMTKSTNRWREELFFFHGDVAIKPPSGSLLKQLPITNTVNAINGSAQ